MMNKANFGQPWPIRLGLNLMGLEKCSHETKKEEAVIKEAQ